MRRRLRNFFFPPVESSLFRRLLPWGTVFGAFIVLLLVIPPAWEYTNTAEFCGTTCHTMPPEYNTYLVSPHARVPCVDCHIGRDWLAKQFLRKSVHLRLIYLQVTGSYEYPIRSKTLRPARETCERCHYPQKFSDDSLRQANHYFADEANTAYELYLLMHTGGGSSREGLGQGIHWHIENRMEFITLDPEQQQIPWVRVYDDQGEYTDFVSLDSELDLNNLGQYEKQELDCVTCHNRVAHHLLEPRRLVDAALTRGDISSSIPYIREKAVEIFEANPDTPDQAYDALRGLDAFYQETYPDYYAANQASVEGAINTLVGLYDRNTYPDQELNWETHPNNIGHRDSPGCFRCHDGKHFSEAGDAVRLECNLCHSIPQVVREGVIEPTLPLATGFEPTSHLDSTWISRHHLEFNETCSNCHTMEDPGGTSDTSFCSNSGCHGVNWKFAGFDAPELREQLGLGAAPPVVESLPEQLASGPVTYQTLLPIFQGLCSGCHGEVPTKGLKLTEYAALMQGSVDGPVIVPGAPDESKLIQVLEAGHFAQVTPDQLALLREWIAAGAPEGEPAAAEAPAEATVTPAAEESEAAPPTAPPTEPAVVEGGEGEAAPPPTAPTPTAEGGFHSWWETQAGAGEAPAAAPPTEAPASPVPATATAAPTLPPAATPTTEFRSWWETQSGQ